MTTDPKFKIRRLWRDKRGAALVLVALSLTALIGMTGLAVDVGLWYTIKRYNQSAADIAALSGVDAGTVKGRLFRARATLRRRLAPYLQSDAQPVSRKVRS